jgi:hypothetical protein
MTGLRHDLNNGLLFISAERMQAVQAKWPRLTAKDLSEIRDRDQLVARVTERYSLPRDQARTDVMTWESQTRF